MSNVSEVCQSVMLRFAILHKLQQLIVEQFRVTTSRGGLDANVRLLDLKVCKNELFLVPPEPPTRWWNPLWKPSSALLVRGSPSLVTDELRNKFTYNISSSYVVMNVLPALNRMFTCSIYNTLFTW